MSRIAKNPVSVPSGVELTLSGDQITAKGPKGEVSMTINPLVSVEQDGDQLKFIAANDSKAAVAMSGTTRALANNLVVGVTEGFEKKLKVVGVGYRVAAKGNKLDLSLGFSHPVIYDVPEGVKIETPSQTEIVITSVDKQKVGQVAAEIRRIRPPEPYKGKGVRYADEHITLKQAKKK
ncbi:MAG: 50S ribosomal protein L6 [Gammaproteobacteria bacterium]|nr:MAG: 50S ribosomal protein L6 [Gammaproteobacteria bacterium]